MPDVFSRETRSRIMASIRGGDTRPEMIVRRVLHRAGFRFRLRRRDLPGTPDIVLPRYKTVVFVNGCFWHSHGCRLTKTPKSNQAYWIKKLETNCLRDRRSQDALRSLGQEGQAPQAGQARLGDAPGGFVGD